MAVQKAFNCVVIAPTGKLMDCQTTSVVFPAYDGQVGQVACSASKAGVVGLTLPAARELAARIRERAIRNQVPIVENPPLARAHLNTDLELELRLDLVSSA